MDPRNSGISAKSREIPPKNVKYREIRQKYFQIHVGKTYLILILAIRPVLFAPNVQIYLETSSLQRVNNVPKLPAKFDFSVAKIPQNHPIFPRILTFFPRNQPIFPRICPWKSRKILLFSVKYQRPWLTLASDINVKRNKILTSSLKIDDKLG